jgi:GTPase
MMTTDEQATPFEEVSPDFRSGFVTILGEPNVGKSTLMNALLDFKVAIVSHKVQTTRDRITGIYTDEACQIVFVDTPGVMDPQNRFNECLRDSALEALEGADIVYHLVDAGEIRPLPQEAEREMAKLPNPVLLVVNKVDAIAEPETLFALNDGEATADEKREAFRSRFGSALDPDNYDDVFFVSALRRKGLDKLRESTRVLLPPGPMLYDPDQPTDRDMRFLASEIVREKVLESLEQELPYAIATQTEEFVEREKAKHRVRVLIFVEHESQKSIVIGKGGDMLRRIGSMARPEIEEMADHPVYLELWVKVRKNWRKREEALREFGYQSNLGKKRSKGGRRRSR